MFFSHRAPDPFFYEKFSFAFIFRDIRNGWVKGGGKATLQLTVP
jgi:hypothetical protein